MKIKVILLFLGLPVLALAQTVQKVVCGKLEHIENFKTQLIEKRNVDIWLPANYDPKNKYAVFYMHDGQMLFDSTKTWNKQSWNVDDVICKLLSEHKVNDFIVVGIWNAGAYRLPNYLPEKPYESLQPFDKGNILGQIQRGFDDAPYFQVNSDYYLRFIVNELKPYIDQHYSVYTDKQHTFIGGSSMGGLISIYAICEYPDVFGGAACISTHWYGAVAIDNPYTIALMNYLKKNLPDPATHKIYYDHGDQTLDANYDRFQKQVDQMMVERGYTSKNWQTLVFPGKDHSEKSWNERLDKPLLFLLGKN